MLSSNISIHISAVDEASRIIESVGTEVQQTLSEVNSVVEETGRNWKETLLTVKDATKAFSGLTTAAWSLYQSIDRVQDMQLTLDRANLKVKATLNALEDAQRRYNEAVAKYGVDSSQAKAAADDLALAEERHRLAVEAAREAHEKYNETVFQTAIMAVPQAITMISSLSDLLKNLKPTISSLSSAIQGLSSSFTALKGPLTAAAVSAGAFMATFTAGYALLQALPEDIRGIAAACMVAIGAVTALAVAWMALQGAMTLGVAIPIIMAAVGFAVAGIFGLIQQAKAMAEGGIVTKPTLALVGEKGPEAVIPLRKGFNFGAQYITVYPTINIGTVSSTVDLETLREHVDKGIADALRRRLP
ncbi:hypothetical protein KEJ24_09045 [Candidatus Bathyarchaeota archaeon]|nr:hypothetical protein [Candidatus Bathyarchaeota archaeon]